MHIHSARVSGYLSPLLQTSHVTFSCTLNQQYAPISFAHQLLEAWKVLSHHTSSFITCASCSLSVSLVSMPCVMLVFLEGITVRFIRILTLNHALLFTCREAPYQPSEIILIAACRACHFQALQIARFPVPVFHTISRTNGRCHRAGEPTGA